MEITQNLWQVGGDRYTSHEDAAIYLIRFGSEAVLIDAGCGSNHQKLADNIASVLPSEVTIEYLFLTHCHYDHTGGAAAIRDQYGCRIVAHAWDAGHLEAGDSVVTAANWYNARMNPLKIDIKINQPVETFAIGDGELISHHCPGHSPGSVVYIAELDSKRVLFGQDVHGPLDPSFLSDREDYLHSLQYMIDLNADILCEGHFGVYRGKEVVLRFIRSYQC